MLVSRALHPRAPRSLRAAQRLHRPLLFVLTGHAWESSASSRSLPTAWALRTPELIQTREKTEESRGGCLVQDTRLSARVCRKYRTPFWTVNARTLSILENKGHSTFIINHSITPSLSCETLSSIVWWRSAYSCHVFVWTFGEGRIYTGG